MAEQGYNLTKKSIGNVHGAVRTVEKLPMDLRKPGSRRNIGTSGSATFFASIKTGSGLSYVADIYNAFAADMTFTAIDPIEEDAVVKVPDGCLDANFNLTVGQAYTVAKYAVGEESLWVITEHVGIS